MQLLAMSNSGKNKMSIIPDGDAPSISLTMDSPLPRVPWSNGSAQASAAISEPPTSYLSSELRSPSLLTHMDRSQSFVPVGLMPTHTNQFTNPLFLKQSSENDGLLSTNHLFASHAPSSSFQQQFYTPGLSEADQAMIDKALDETQEILYQNQLNQNSNSNPLFSYWQNQSYQNLVSDDLVSYHTLGDQTSNPTLQQPTSQSANSQGAGQFSHYPPTYEQRAQVPTLTQKRQSPTSPEQHEQVSPARQQYPVQQKYQQSTGQSQYFPAREQTEQGLSRKRLRRDSQNQPNYIPPTFDRPSSRTDSLRQTLKTPRQQLSHQLPQQVTPDQIRSADPAHTPTLTTPAPNLIAPSESVLTPPPTTKITTSATYFLTTSLTTLTTNVQKYHNWPERYIAYDIAASLMLSGIYLDSVSSVDDSAAWLEWAFSIQGIWKRRSIVGIPGAVPHRLLGRFEEKYGDGKIIPAWGEDGQLILEQEEKECGDG